MWPTVKKYLTKGKTLYFSHGFGITYKDQTSIIPPKDIDVILVAPKGSGTSLRRLFVEGNGLNSSFAIYQDYTGKAKEKVISLGIGVGSGYLFETTFKKINLSLVIFFCSLINLLSGLSFPKFQYE